MQYLPMRIISCYVRHYEEKWLNDLIGESLNAANSDRDFHLVKLEEDGLTLVPSILTFWSLRAS